MTRTDYNLPIFENTDVADLNEYTEELAEALKDQIDRFGNPLTFKGIVATLNDLPNDASAGDIYNVTSINKNYVYSGTEWLEYSDALDNSCEDMISDQYDSTQTYAVGDYCIYNNTLYKCITAIGTAEEFNLEHWVPTKTSDELEKLSCVNVTATGQDLNDYKTRGLYWFGNTAPANRPANIAGWLEVIEYNNQYVRQIWHRSSAINGSAEFETYTRFTNNGGTNWSNWAKYQIHEDSGWQTPTLTNGNATSSNYICQYRKINGIVYIKGNIQGITEPCALFTLPMGYRPTGIQRFMNNTEANLSKLNLITINGSTGVVELGDTTVTGSHQVKLDGICFVADN